MKRYYRIKKFESDLPEVFPDYIVVYTQAIEKSSNLIRLFVSKPLILNHKRSKSQQEFDIEIYAERFVGNLVVRSDYEVIRYTDNLKFTKFKKRKYSRYLLNRAGKRVRDL